MSGTSPTSATTKAPARRGRPVMKVLSVDEVATMLELPALLVKRQMTAGLIPGSYQERTTNEWVVGERGLQRILERKVEQQYSFESVAAILELSYDHIWRAAKAGTITKCRVLGVWRIPESELVRLTRQPMKRRSALTHEEDAA